MTPSSIALATWSLLGPVVGGARVVFFLRLRTRLRLGLGSAAGSEDWLAAANTAAATGWSGSVGVGTAAGRGVDTAAAGRVAGCAGCTCLAGWAGRAIGLVGAAPGLSES